VIETLKSEGLKLKPQCHGQKIDVTVEEEKEFTFTLSFCCFCALNRLDDTININVEGFSSLGSQNANFLLKHPHRHIQK
jgi:hypothetical protein